MCGDGALSRGGRWGSSSFAIYRMLRWARLRDDQVVEERIERGDRDAERSGEEPHEEVERTSDEAEATGNSQIVNVLVAARPRVRDAAAAPSHVPEGRTGRGSPCPAMCHARRS